MTPKNAHIAHIANSAPRGESPAARSWWWTCDVSPRNTCWRLERRRTNASALSARGTPSATSGSSSVSTAVPLRFSSSDTAASVSPRNWLPVSPMNTLAGGKFQRRKPAHEPIMSAAMNIT